MSLMGGDVSQTKDNGGYSWLNGAMQYRNLDNQKLLGHEIKAEVVGYYKNGNMRFRCPVVEGGLHGICFIWHDTGRLESRTLYFRGISLFKQAGIDKGSDTVTAQDIINIKNATARRECLKEFGYERFLAELKHDVIDKKEDYELVKVNWHREEEPICLVKVKCPSTGAFYTLRVPPTTKTVKEGVAWTFGVGEKEYLPEQES